MSAWPNTLDPRLEALVELTAQRVVEMLEEREPGRGRLVDASEMARILGVTRGTVYQHAEELGATRLGDGPKARLLFDPGRALPGGSARSPSEGSEEAESPATRPRSRGRARRVSGADGDLLPIKGSGQQ